MTSELFLQSVRRLSEQIPMVHCLTNDVVTNFTANVLLAVGASPAMVVAREEIDAFVPLANALLINVGTLTSSQLVAMELAVKSAQENKVPWVLDPVAVGALSFRTDFCRHLLQFQPAVIRGNASEIAVLAGQDVFGRGTDSVLSSSDVLDSAKAVAQKFHTVVAMTGETDYVTDGKITYALNNGHIWLTKVTGAGCALSAVVAAYCAVCASPVDAALCALSHMALAGENAAAQSHGVGSFAVSLLDCLQNLLSSGCKERLACQKI